MKKSFKRAMAVLLSLTIVLSLVVVALPSAAALDIYTDIPTVYIEGQGTGLGIPNGDGTYEKIYSTAEPSDSLKVFWK